MESDPAPRKKKKFAALKENFSRIDGIIRSRYFEGSAEMTRKATCQASPTPMKP